MLSLLCLRPVCLFLAGKVCNYVFDIDNYVASFDKLKREDILGIEYLVLQTLRFDVYVPRTQDALHGWFLQLQVSLFLRRVEFDTLFKYLASIGREPG